MGAFAEFERERIRERQREGITLTTYRGRKKALSDARPGCLAAPSRRDPRTKRAGPGFFRSLGAEPQDEWVRYHLERDALCNRSRRVVLG